LRSRRRRGDDDAASDDDDDGKKNSTSTSTSTSTSKNKLPENDATYLVGYDFGNSSAVARVSRPKRARRIVQNGIASTAISALSGDKTRTSRAVGGSATWFQKGNHVRLEGEADLFGGRAVGWGTYTLNDEADQINSTGINLVERERGFVISPFTAATAVAAAGVEADFGFGKRGGGATASSISSSGGGRWKGALAFDFNKVAPYLAVARETTRAPLWLRGLVPPATSGKGLVGGVGGHRARRGDGLGLEEGGANGGGGGGGGGHPSARIAAHLSPTDRVAMLTLELGNGGGGGNGNRGGRNHRGLGGVVVGGGSSLSSSSSAARPKTAPFKAFVRARTDGKGFLQGQGLRGVLAGLSGGAIFNHTVEI